MGPCLVLPRARGVRKSPIGLLTEGPSVSAGRHIAALLTGSWRSIPGFHVWSEAELAPLVPRLLEAGAGGLAWWSLSRTAESQTYSTGVFRDAFRYQLARSRVAESHIKASLGVLRSHGVEPILGKGWAVAQSYASAGLRPTGDIDLYVDPSDFPRAQAAIRNTGAPVDLHRGCDEIGGDPWSEAFARSVVRPCDQVSVRCFGPSDHLRLVIRHLLRHGAWRSLWLCDVAALLEFEPLDWRLVLSGPGPAVSWVQATVKLARDLLGARIPDNAPEEHRSGPPPDWLVRAVLNGWGRPFLAHGRRAPMSAVLGRPWDFVRGLRDRWPNEIEAAIELGLSADQPPRPSVKLRASLRRTSRFLKARPQV